MKSLCVMDSVSRLGSGRFEAEKGLQRELGSQANYQVQVVGLRDQFSDVDAQEWAPLTPLLCAVRGPIAFGFSTELTKTLLQSGSDLAYCAGLWRFPSWAALRWASATGRPLVVAPHGMTLSKCPTEKSRMFARAVPKRGSIHSRLWPKEPCRHYSEWD